MVDSSPKAEERRRHRRVPVAIVIDYEAADEFFQDYASNVSLGGIFIRTTDTLTRGTRLKIHFSVPEHDDFIDGWGTVVRVHNGGGGEPKGMGIAFEELDGPAKAVIDELARAGA